MAATQFRKNHFYKNITQNIKYQPMYGVEEDDRIQDGDKKNEGVITLGYELNTI